MALSQKKITIELSPRDRALLERIAEALESTKVEAPAAKYPGVNYPPNVSPGLARGNIYN